MNQIVTPLLPEQSNTTNYQRFRSGAINLTPREQDVLALLACGLSNKKIARVLGISPHTVGGYLKEIYFKLGVNNRAAATLAAIQRGLLGVDAGSMTSVN